MVFSKKKLPTLRKSGQLYIVFESFYINIICARSMQVVVMMVVV